MDARLAYHPVNACLQGPPRGPHLCCSPISPTLMLRPRMFSKSNIPSGKETSFAMSTCQLNRIKQLLDPSWRFKGSHLSLAKQRPSRHVGRMFASVKCLPFKTCWFGNKVYCAVVLDSHFLLYLFLQSHELKVRTTQIETQLTALKSSGKVF